MSVIAAAVRALMAAGAAEEVILATIEEMEASLIEATRPKSSAELRRERNQRYYQARKERLNSDGERLNQTQGVLKRLNEEAGEPSPLPPTPPISTPDQAPSKKAPTGPKKVSPRRSSMVPLPEGWQPSESHYAKGTELGYSREQVDEMAERMRLWAGEKDQRCVDWGLRFHRWIREQEGKGGVPKAKPQIGDETFLDKLLQHYPKTDQPYGTDRDETMAALIEARRKDTDERILAGVLGYAQQLKAEGRPQDKIPALKRFLAREHWRNCLPKEGEKPRISPEQADKLWRDIMDTFKKRPSSWAPVYGPKPGERGCKVPVHILTEYGYGDDSPTAMSA